MAFFRSLALAGATSLFSILLTVTALFVSVYMVLDTPQTIKKTLKQANIYPTLVDSTLEESKTATVFPEADTAVRNALAQAFTPSYVQKTTEHTLDTTYEWVHGVRQKPDFTLDLTEPKAAFASSIGAAVQQKLDALPVCEGITAPPTSLVELYALSCKPRRVPSETIALGVQQQTLRNSFFEKAADPALSNLQDVGGKQITERLAFLPDAHRYFLLSLYVLPAVLLLLGLGIVLWASTKQGGVKIIARTLLGVGLTTIVIALVSLWLLGNTLQSDVGQQEAGGAHTAIQDKLFEAMRLLMTQFRSWWVGIGAGYVVLALGLLLGLRLAGKKGQAENESLNKALGYNNSIPSAGTTFGPGKEEAAKADGPEPPAPHIPSRSGKQTKNPR